MYPRPLFSLKFLAFSLMLLYIPKYKSTTSLYNVTCMYVFRGDLLVLDNTPVGDVVLFKEDYFS